MAQTPVLFETLLRLGDNTLVLGHRLSEWCGHAPVLEEDIALANTALDLIGQTQMWLGLAAEAEGQGRTADDLAMLRDVWDFRNVLLVEQPNGDFGQTIMRQYLFDQFHFLHLTALEASGAPDLADVAAKAVKEVTYHLDRSREIVIALGDGTEESHGRLQAALTRLWPYAGEMLNADDIELAAAKAGLAPSPETLRGAYTEAVAAVMAEATLVLPEGGYAHSGGKTGFRHSEHLGHLLTQMQWMQRAYPGARW